MTHRAKILGIDKQVLSVPFQLLTASLESSENSYIRNLEQIYLKERYKNYQLQQRNESLLRIKRLPTWRPSRQREFFAGEKKTYFIGNCKPLNLYLNLHLDQVGMY